MGVLPNSYFLIAKDKYPGKKMFFIDGGSTAERKKELERRNTLLPRHLRSSNFVEIVDKSWKQNSNSSVRLSFWCNSEVDLNVEVKDADIYFSGVLQHQTKTAQVFAGEWVSGENEVPADCRIVAERSRCHEERWNAFERYENEKKVRFCQRKPSETNGIGTFAMLKFVDLIRDSFFQNVTKPEAFVISPPRKMKKLKK